MHLFSTANGSSPGSCWSTSSFLPLGFQSCLVMLLWGRLRMCLIQCHFRFLTVFVMNDWPVLVHSSEVLNLSGPLPTGVKIALYNYYTPN